MTGVLISSEKLLERLGREEQQMKFLGLHGHAAGIRTAITILIRLSQEARQSPVSPLQSTLPTDRQEAP